MFTIPVGHLLESYPGDTETLQFEWDILPDLYDDLEIIGVLRFELSLISREEGIEAVIRHLETTAIYEWKKQDVHIEEASRSFVTTADLLAPDDIGLIHAHDKTIDLTPIIREEIIMSIF